MAAQETGFLWSADLLTKHVRSAGCIQKNFMKDTVRNTSLRISSTIVSGKSKARETCVVCDVENMDNYEKIKGRLFIRLLNADKNRDVLKDTIYHQVGDIALVLYYLAGEKEGYILSTKVKDKFLEKWGKDREVVFESALVNTYFISPPRIYHWEKMLFDKEYAGDNFMDILSQYKPNRGISGNCLSTEKRTNGSCSDFSSWSGQTAGRASGI